MSISISTSMTVDKFLTKMHLIETITFYSISEPFPKAIKRQK